MSINLNPLLDRIMSDHQPRLRNDAALSRLLEVAPPVISKLRRNQIPAGPAIVLKLVELGGIPLADVRAVIPRKSLDHE